MAVKLRLKRVGTRNTPVYRIVATDGRAKRDGRPIEELGTYDPVQKEEPNFTINLERAEYWLGTGAQPSDTVRSFIRKARRAAKGLPPIEPKVKAKPAPAAEKPAAELSKADEVAAAIFSACKGLGTREEDITRAVVQLDSREEWDAVVNAFKTRHADFYDGDLMQCLDKELSDVEMEGFVVNPLREKGIQITDSKDSEPDAPEPEPAAEDTPADEPTAEEPTAEESTAEEPAAEEPAAEEPAAEEPAAEEPVTEETPAEDNAEGEAKSDENA